MICATRKTDEIENKKKLKTTKKKEKSQIICNLTCSKLTSIKCRLIQEIIKTWLTFSGQDEGWLIIYDYA